MHLRWLTVRRSRRSHALSGPGRAIDGQSGEFPEGALLFPAVEIGLYWMRGHFSRPATRSPGGHQTSQRSGAISTSGPGREQARHPHVDSEVLRPLATAPDEPGDCPSGDARSIAGPGDLGRDLGAQVPHMLSPDVRAHRVRIVFVAGLTAQVDLDRYQVAVSADRPAEPHEDLLIVAFADDVPGTVLFAPGARFPARRCVGRRGLGSAEAIEKAHNATLSR
jgi:hypothetical protein